MAYTAWSVVYGEQPTAAKWNQLGTNDAGFKDGTLIDADVLDYTKLGNGAVVQVVYTAFTAAASGGVAIPYDDTIPQNTEGTQFMTQAITPKYADSILVIECEANLSCDISGKRCASALFQDTTANALAANDWYIGTGTQGNTVTLRHIMVSGTTSSTTFKLRAGAVDTSTIRFNGSDGTRKFGAISKSTMKITEIKVV